MKNSFDIGDFNFDDVKNKPPEIVVKALIDYASEQKLKVPQKTQERWIECPTSDTYNNLLMAFKFMS